MAGLTNRHARVNGGIGLRRRDRPQHARYVMACRTSCGDGNIGVVLAAGPHSLRSVARIALTGPGRNVVGHLVRDVAGVAGSRSHRIGRRVLEHGGSPRRAGRGMAAFTCGDAIMDRGVRLRRRDRPQHARYVMAGRTSGGDRNICVGTATNCGLGLNPVWSLQRGDATVGWTNALHGLTGNLLLNGGQVVEASTAVLQHFLEGPDVDVPGQLHLLQPTGP